jgi:hypothetical protein
MTSSKPAKPDVITYGDYEVITPDTSKLRKTVHPARPDDPDPVIGAEVALASLSSEFSTWMVEEIDRLDAARRAVKQWGLSAETEQELFLAAHDIKGDGHTLGFPEVAPAAESLCRLIEHSPDLNRVPLVLVDQHVDAVRAIVREYRRPDIVSVATTLTAKLRTVTDEFLIAENHDRPDVLKAIKSPGLTSGAF